MIGKRVGNWIIDEELGRGGMGRVYLVHEVVETGEPRRAALKMVAAELAQETGFVVRFTREIDSLRTLRHANIVQLYESGQYEGRYYYVMEYVDGPSLETLLHERGRLPPEMVLEMALQICPALKHAHDHGIIHRDLKPANLLLRQDGVVKLTDFGVAHVFASTPLTATNAVVGTADYMSPEQAAGKPVTKRSDLYSLGIVMYALLTGRKPFQAESALEMLHKHRYARFDSPQKIVPEIPHGLDAIVCQLLEKDPDKRPADGLVLARQLDSLRRRLAQKQGEGDDDIYAGETLAMEQERAAPITESGPATLMSRLMRAELESMNRPGPISRMLDRAWLLVLLLAIVIGLFVWGLWPQSGPQLLADARQLAESGDWDQAVRKLDRLDKKAAEDRPDAAEVLALRQQIEEGRAREKARRLAGNRSDVFTPPGSEAERFYLEGVQAYRNGQSDLGRSKWRRLIEAFTGVDSEKHWVVLAKEALDQSLLADLAALDAAIQLALNEPPDQRTKRLQALTELYRDRQDDVAKTARGRIQKAIEDAGKNEPSTPQK